jgi:hypothetical protein
MIPPASPSLNAPGPAGVMCPELQSVIRAGLSNLMPTVTAWVPPSRPERESAAGGGRRHGIISLYSELLELGLG